MFLAGQVGWVKALRRRTSAFTLTEVMLAVGLLAVAILAVIGLFTSTIRMQVHSQERAAATSLARRMMERVRSEPNVVPAAPASWIGGELASTPLDSGPPPFPPAPYPFENGYALDVYLEQYPPRPDMKLVRVVVRWDGGKSLEIQTLIRN
jgi:type II secretory pathway pseudopilin PulG